MFALVSAVPDGLVIVKESVLALMAVTTPLWVCRPLVPLVGVLGMAIAVTSNSGVTVTVQPVAVQLVIATDCATR